MRREKRGDEAEHVAFYRAVLGFLVLRLDRSDHAREAAPPVEPVPGGLAGAVQGEALVFHIADAGDQGHDDALALDLAGDDLAGGRAASRSALRAVSARARGKRTRDEGRGSRHGSPTLSRPAPGLSPRSCARQRAQPREGRAHGPSLLVSWRVSRRAVSTVKSVTRED